MADRNVYCSDCGARLFHEYWSLYTGKCDSCRNKDAALTNQPDVDRDTRCSDCRARLVNHRELSSCKCEPCLLALQKAEGINQRINQRAGSIYESFDQCVLDIMANTDAPYLAALVAAGKVYHENWQFVEAPPDRGVAIAPPNEPERHVIIRMEG